MQRLKIAAATLTIAAAVAVAGGAHAAEQCFYMNNVQNSRAAERPHRLHAGRRR